jgi:signal peptidase I
MKIIKDLLTYICIVVLVILIRVYIITPAQVIGSSMEPTLINKEIMLLNKIDYNFNDIERFDIVVIHIPNEKPLVKRVIGLPTETVEYKNGELYINNKLVKEPILLNKTEDYQLPNGPIPNDKYFVLGDNRGNSIDSRIIGLINRKDIIGTTSFVIYPFNRFGKVR